MNLRSNPWLCVMTVIVAGACARSAAPMQAPHTAKTEADPATASWTTTILPPSTSDRTVVIGPSLYRILEGRRRLASEDGEIEVPSDIPGAKLVDFDLAGDGTTVFVDELGSLYRAPSFTGTLTALPTDGARWKHVAVTDEHAFACAADGALARVALRGAARVERLRQRCAKDLHPPLLAMKELLYVVDAKHRLLRTRDGETFTPVATGADAIVELSTYRGAWALTEKGLLRLEPDGTATRVAASDQQDPPLGLWRNDEQEAAIRALERSYDERYGGSWAIHSAYRGVDERFWSCSSLDCAPIGSEPPARTLEGRCETLRASATMLALCRSEHERDGTSELSIHRLATTGWTLRARMPWPDDDFFSEPAALEWVVGDDGAVVINAPCRGAEDLDEAGGLCWLDGDAWRQIDEPDYGGMPQTRLVTLHDRTLVAEPAEGVFVRVDLASGSVAQLGSSRERLVADPVFHGDVLLAAVEADERLAVLAHAGDMAHRVPLPRGATSVAFASATRFLAAGRTADRLWTTTDGGTTWAVLEVPVDGDPRAVALDDAYCTNAACTAAPVAWVDPGLLAVIDHRPPKLVAPPCVERGGGCPAAADTGD